MKELLLLVPAKLTHLAGPEIEANLKATERLTTCPHCGQDVYIGPRGEKAVAEGRADMMCMVCAFLKGILTYENAEKTRKLTDEDN